MAGLNIPTDIPTETEPLEGDIAERRADIGTLFRGLEICREKLTLTLEDYKDERFHERDFFEQAMLERVENEYHSLSNDDKLLLKEEIRVRKYDQWNKEHMDKHCPKTIERNAQLVEGALILDVNEYKNEAFHDKGAFKTHLQQRAQGLLPGVSPEMVDEVLKKLEPFFEAKYQEWNKEHMDKHCPKTIERNAQLVEGALILDVNEYKNEAFHDKGAFKTHLQQRAQGLLPGVSPEMVDEVLKKLEPFFEAKYQEWNKEHMDKHCPKTIERNAQLVEGALILDVNEYKNEAFHDKGAFKTHLQQRAQGLLPGVSPEMVDEVLKKLEPFFEAKYQEWNKEHMDKHCPKTIERNAQLVEGALILDVNEYKNEAFHDKGAFKTHLQQRAQGLLPGVSPEMVDEVLKKLEPFFEAKYQEWNKEHMDKHCPKTIERNVQMAIGMISLSGVDPLDESLSDYTNFKGEILRQIESVLGTLPSEEMRQSVLAGLESHIETLHNEWTDSFEAEKLRLDQEKQVEAEKEQVEQERIEAEETEKQEAEAQEAEAEQEVEASQSKEDVQIDAPADIRIGNLADSSPQQAVSDVSDAAVEPDLGVQIDEDVDISSPEVDVASDAFDVPADDVADASDSSFDDSSSAAGESLVPGVDLVGPADIVNSADTYNKAATSSVLVSDIKSSAPQFNQVYSRADVVGPGNDISEAQGSIDLSGQLSDLASSEKSSAVENATEYTFLMEPELQEFLREKRLLDKPELFELLDELFPLACREHFSGGYHFGMDWLKMKKSDLFHRFSSFFEKTQKKPDELFEMLRLTWGKPKYSYLKGSFMPPEEFVNSEQTPSVEAPVHRVESQEKTSVPTTEIFIDESARVEHTFLSAEGILFDSESLVETDEMIADRPVDDFFTDDMTTNEFNLPLPDFDIDSDTVDGYGLLDVEEVASLDEEGVLFDESDADGEFEDLEGVIFDEDQESNNLDEEGVEEDELAEDDSEQNEDVDEVDLDEPLEEADEQDVEENDILDALDEPVFEAIESELDEIGFKEDVLSLLSNSTSATEFFENIKQNSELIEWLDLMKRRYGLNEVVLYLLLKGLLKDQLADFTRLEKGREQAQMAEIDVEVSLSLKNLFRTLKRSLNDVGCELIWNFHDVSNRVYTLSEKVLQGFKYNLENSATRHYSYLIELDTKNGLYIKVKSVALEINPSRISPKETYHLPLRREQLA